MKIETPRLLMRHPNIDDCKLLENLWRNKKVRKYLGGIVSDHLINQKIAAFINHWDLHHFGLCTVLEKNSNEIIGLCGLHYSEDGVEISYMFFPYYWGKGFAYEAVMASIDHGFKMLHLEHIIAITQAKNTKSCLLLKKVGMNHTSTFERFNAIQNLYELTQYQWNMDGQKFLS